MKKIKRRPILPITIVIIIVICRNISAPALSAVELEDGIISMPVLDSDWSVFSLLVRKTHEFLFLTQDQRSILPSSSRIGFSGGEL